MITIKQIADLVGVSRGTVDRVVNKRGGVNPVVEKKIAAVIKQYGYKPNKVGRALVRRQKLFTIGVISASLGNIFFHKVREGIRLAESELRHLGVTLIYREVAMFSVAEQLRSIEHMLAEGIDALAINPLNDPAVREKLREATHRGIPLVTFNTDIVDVERFAYIGCDYLKSGRIAAGLIKAATQGKAATAIITGSPTSLGHKLRVQGFSEEVERHPEMRVVDVVEMFDDDEIAYVKTRECLDNHEDLDAIYLSAAGKNGSIAAIRETFTTKRPLIVTVDYDNLTRDCLLDGTVFATICQQPIAQGYEPIRQLANYLLYGDVPEQVVQYTQAEIIIKQSIDPEYGNSEEKWVQGGRTTSGRQDWKENQPSMPDGTIRLRL